MVDLIHEIHISAKGTRERVTSMLLDAEDLEVLRRVNPS